MEGKSGDVKEVRAAVGRERVKGDRKGQAGSFGGKRSVVWWYRGKGKAESGRTDTEKGRESREKC